MVFALMSCFTILVVGSVEAVVEYAQVNKGRAGKNAAMLRREIPPIELRIRGLEDDDSEERDDDDDEKDDEGLTPYRSTDHRDSAFRQTDHESKMSGLEDDDSEEWDDGESEMSPNTVKVKKIKPKGSEEHDDETDDEGLSPTNAKVMNAHSENSEEHDEETDGAAFKGSNTRDASNLSDVSWSGQQEPPAGSDTVASYGRNETNGTNLTNGFDITMPPPDGASEKQGEFDGLTESERRHRVERAAMWAEKIERRANELKKTDQTVGLHEEKEETENMESSKESENIDSIVNRFEKRRKEEWRRNSKRHSSIAEDGDV